ncbi:NAD(P)/FAD-dependent oxidoreductase [Lagierella sp.]|uniref:NAD(P)/FAD-dependent oxidoreductase n=1 Tax=Lagierella sp. TaxID=2849657 RepID=UPI002631F33E|nr:NAD(P)/FAD-dependent oxidoreductase [Lagierella sp.]
MKDIIVLGGGPSGMMAAIAAKNENNNVTLIEQNEKLGKKLYITGKGRCNITNYRDISEFFTQMNRNGKFLYSSFYTFTNMDILDLLSKNGLEYKVERGERVFPKTDKSSDVIKTFKKILVDKEISLIFNQKIKYIEKRKSKFYLYSKDERYSCDYLVVATGGLSYQSTGSTGDGYKFAKNFGLNITQTYPGLVGVNLKGDLYKKLTGVNLKNVEITLLKDNKKFKTDFGEALFTHYGISGPIILSLSSLIYPNSKYSISIDLKPGLNISQLDDRINRDFNKYLNKDIENGLKDLLIKSLIEPILFNAEIPKDKKINQITKEERARLVKAIKQFEFDIAGLRDFNEAIVTRGGIDVVEIDSSTMESKKVQGLYFTGEVLDLDGFTGGYNLQIAYSTGFLAGNSIKEKSNDNK